MMNVYKSAVFYSLLVLLLGVFSTVSAQWSADMLAQSAVDPASTGALVPANELPEAAGKPQNISLHPMNGTPSPPAGSLAQRYVFVRNGETLNEWPPEVRGRIALVKMVDPQIGTHAFAQIANNGALAGAVAVMFVSATTNPTAVAGTIPSANISPDNGEVLIDLISATDDDSLDPPNGAISEFPLRINPFLREQPPEDDGTRLGGAFRGTRVPSGVTPAFGSNPNTAVAFSGEPLRADLFPIGRDAAEPTVGVNKNGTAFYAAGAFDGAGGTLARTEVFRSRDGGRSWVSVQPVLPDPLLGEPPGTLDPMVYVEEDTGRVFNFETLAAGCVYLLYTDDEGETWNRNPVACDVGGITDHQTIFAGPPPAGQESLAALFPEFVYACINTVYASNCLRSLDGGMSFTKVGSAFIGVESGNEGAGDFFGVEDLCGGLTGHMQTDSEGRVFLPAGRCAAPTIARSEDGGLTWERILVNGDVLLPFSEGDDAVEGLDDGNEHEVTLAVDAADNLYMVWWDHNDNLPYLVTSTDHGSTWSAPLMIAPPGVEGVNFPTLSAGDAGRIVVHFPATFVNDKNDESRPWHAIQVVSTNALDDDPLFLWTSANNPADPIHRGDCLGRCAGMFDFLDVVVPPKEAPDFAQGYWAAVTDTCTGPCITGNGAAGAAVGMIARQLSGPSLRAPAPVAAPVAAVDVTDRIELQAANARFVGGVVSFDLGLRNVSAAQISAPLRSEIVNLNSSSGNVTAANADNGEPAAGAFWRFDNRLNGDAELAAGETSQARNLAFNDQSGEPFSVTFRVLSGPEAEAVGSGDGGASGLSVGTLIRLTINPLVGGLAIDIL